MSDAAARLEVVGLGRPGEAARSSTQAALATLRERIGELRAAAARAASSSGFELPAPPSRCPRR